MKLTPFQACLSVLMVITWNSILTILSDILVGRARNMSIVGWGKLSSFHRSSGNIAILKLHVISARSKEDQRQTETWQVVEK